MKNIDQKTKDWRKINIKVRRLQLFEIPEPERTKEVQEVDDLMSKYFEKYNEPWVNTYE